MVVAATELRQVPTWCVCCVYREVLYEEGPDGLPVVTGMRMTRAGKEELVTADAYVAALDVPGAKKLIPQVLQEPQPRAQGSGPDSGHLT